MSGRFTGDNIRLVYDILNHSQVHRNKGILLLIDFEKAFDSVSWSFMEKCFKFFNFKDDAINWIKVFYKNIKSSVIVNNKPTPWFNVERGCRQGDPISPYIFLLCSEVLAHMIRQDEEIKGFKMLNNEIKISQYADDTSLFLDGSQEGFEKCVNILLEYAKYSGLAMNFDKTKVIWFGCQDENKPVFMPELNFDWNPEKFTLLGVEFTQKLDNISDYNIENKLGEIQRIINSWSKRDITPYGRVTVIKSLLVSKIVHILISLPSPSSKMIKKLDIMFYDFLWDGKPDKIKRKNVKLKVEQGGLGMIDLETFDKALKLTWIRRMLNGNSKWKNIILNIYPDINKITHYGDNFVKTLSYDIDNPFWKNIMSYFVEFQSKNYISTLQDLKATCFQFNDDFKIGNAVINIPILKRKNIFFVHQLMENNIFMTYENFCNKYDIQINYLTYLSIITCIKDKFDIDTLDDNNKELNYPPSINAIFKNKKGAALIYKIFFQYTCESKGQKKWTTLIDVSEEEWLSSFFVLKNTTKDCKLRWLQCRILHNILTTNRSVSKYKNNQTDLCSFCGLSSETISHLFWDCHFVKESWNRILHILRTRCSHTDRLCFNKQLILFGQCANIYTDKVFDLIILMAKAFIYRCKVQGNRLNVTFFVKEIYTRYCIEEKIYNNSVQFKNNWQQYQNIFKSLL